jgi:H+/Cl- antiporter ClcA
LAVSAADLILGLGLAAYWVALVMPGQLILSIYEAYSRYYIVFAIFAILGAIGGFIGVFFACWRKFFK